MSIAWTPNPARPPRGAAPVGNLAELSGLERRAVMYLRLWCADEAGREAVVADVSRGLSTAKAAQLVNDFAALLQVMLLRPRREIMHHSADCACFGGDEAVFAHMVAAGAAGDREDAMAFALTLMHPDAAWSAVQISESVGLALLGLSRRPYTRH